MTTETTKAEVIDIGSYLKPKRVVRVDMLEYHDGQFTFQIHDNDTKEIRSLVAARMRTFADHLENDDDQT